MHNCLNFCNFVNSDSRSGLLVCQNPCTHVLDVHYCYGFHFLKPQRISICPLTSFKLSISINIRGSQHNPRPGRKQKKTGSHKKGLPTRPCPMYNILSQRFPYRDRVLKSSCGGFSWSIQLSSCPDKSVISGLRPGMRVRSLLPRTVFAYREYQASQYKSIKTRPWKITTNITTLELC